MSVLVAIISYNKYDEDKYKMQTEILSAMRICSFELVCEEFKIDFVPKSSHKTYSLYSNNQGLQSYFPILNSQDNFLMLSLSPKKYKEKIETLKISILKSLIPMMIGIAILSVLFSLYSLYPLRNALKLTEEFIKDILHDFNTPLSSLRINSAMLTREIGENKKVKRIESSVENILKLQENLSFFLHNHEMQQEEFLLKSMIENSVNIMEKSYPDIQFSIDVDDNLRFLTNKRALKRVIDNLLTNGAKYNKKNGSVWILYCEEKKELQIKDTGKGIRNPNQIFQRFYTEHERGLGIGLHIVHKLCNELNIKIGVESVVNEGTTFSLDIKNLILFR